MIMPTARTVADGLRQMPLALALVVINILFLTAGTLMVREFVKGLDEARKERAALVERIEKLTLYCLEIRR
jgi:hypothetical protein